MNNQLNHAMSILEHITPIQRLDTNRAEEITRKLERLIEEWRLEAGASLGTKEELRRRFQVSPGTMNEAVRILESRGVVEMRRGSKGGVFVSTSSVQVALKQVVPPLDRNAALVEDCWAVSQQLEPLVVVEATKRARVDAVAELNSLFNKMAAAVDDPTESLRCSWFLYRRIAEMGSNAVLAAIYTALLDFLEHKTAQVASTVNDSIPRQVVARSRRVVDAIASGNTQRAATVVA
jgi:GntR family transcriptional repressor for pyruvate dehydrogenase complex